MKIGAFSKSKARFPLLSLLVRTNEILLTDHVCRQQIANWTNVRICIVNVEVWNDWNTDVIVKGILYEIYSLHPDILVVILGKIPVGTTTRLHEHYQGYRLLYCNCQLPQDDEGEQLVRIVVGTDMKKEESFLLAKSFLSDVFSCMYGHERMMATIASYDYAELLDKGLASYYNEK